MSTVYIVCLSFSVVFIVRLKHDSIVNEISAETMMFNNVNICEETTGVTRFLPNSSYKEEFVRELPYWNSWQTAVALLCIDKVRRGNDILLTSWCRAIAAPHGALQHEHRKSIYGTCVVFI